MPPAPDMALFTWEYKNMTPALSTYDKLMMEAQFEYLSAMEDKKALWHASKQKGRDIFKAQLKALKLQRKK